MLRCLSAQLTDKIAAVIKRLWISGSADRWISGSVDRWIARPLVLCIICLGQSQAKGPATLSMARPKKKKIVCQIRTDLPLPAWYNNTTYKCGSLVEPALPINSPRYLGYLTRLLYLPSPSPSLPLSSSSSSKSSLAGVPFAPGFHYALRFYFH